MFSASIYICTLFVYTHNILRRVIRTLDEIQIWERKRNVYIHLRRSIKRCRCRRLNFELARACLPQYIQCNITERGKSRAPQRSRCQSPWVSSIFYDEDDDDRSREMRERKREALTQPRGKLPPSRDTNHITFSLETTLDNCFSSRLENCKTLYSYRAKFVKESIDFAFYI